MTSGPIAQELRAALAQPNLRAFLAMLRVGEGTADVGGYSRLFGGGQVASFADHPRTPVTAPLGNNKSITSTAAGAYQFLSRTWDEVRDALQLTDFMPATQDLAAAYLIRRRGALADVLAGRVQEAIAKCAKEWASLPGSPYGQPTRTMAQALASYTEAGGCIGGPGDGSIAPASAAPAQASTTTTPPTSTTQRGAPPQAAPTHRRTGDPMLPLIPFIAAALPALIEAAPGLIRIFGSSPQAEKNAKAAEAVAEIAKTVTGQPTVEGAVTAIQADPTVAAAFREECHRSMGELLGFIERVNALEQSNIAAARLYNTEEPLFLDTRWVKVKFIHLLSLVFVGFSGYFVQKYWGDLTPELRGAVITLMIIAGWNGVRDYWMGSSSGSDRKTQMLSDKST